MPNITLFGQMIRNFDRYSFKKITGIYQFDNLSKIVVNYR